MPRPYMRKCVLTFFPHGRRFLLVRYSRIFHHFRGGAFSSHSTTFATVTVAWRDISDRPENIGIITNEFLTAMGALLKYRFVFLLLAAFGLAGADVSAQT